MKGMYFVGGTKNFDGSKTSSPLEGLARELFLSSNGPKLYARAPENRLTRVPHVHFLGHKTTSPMKSQLRAAAAWERWKQGEEQRKLQTLLTRESMLW